MVRHCVWLGFALAGAVQADGMRPGEWSITTRVVAGEGRAAVPAMNFHHCLKADDVARPAEAIARLDDALRKQQCVIERRTETESHAQFEMSCKGVVPMTMRGDFVFGPVSYQGTIEMRARGAAGEMNVRTEVSARRVGDCAPVKPPP